MLSKAEILYLQGQKQVSQSYERKLKCLIRKKLDVLQKELPLLSKLFGDSVNSFMDISSTEELAVPIDKITMKQTETSCNLLLCYNMQASSSKFNDFSS